MKRLGYHIILLLVAPIVVAAAADPGTGLRADYFNGTDFYGVPVDRIDSTVDFDWGTGSPAPGIGSDDFTVHWSGFLVVPTSGTYTFSTTSDDGVLLAINGHLVIDDWTLHGATTDQGTVDLVSGRSYSISMRMYEHTGSAVAKLHWSGPGLADQVIPQSALFPGPAYDPLALVITSPFDSWTSPAWLEGTIASETSMVSATVDGCIVRVVRDGSGAWYGDASTSGSSLGVPLVVDRDVDAQVTTAAGGQQRTETHRLHWKAVDLSQPGPSTSLDVRINDQIQVVVAQGDKPLRIEMRVACGPWTVVAASLEPTAHAVIPFPAAGSYEIRSLDGITPVTSVLVTAFSADLLGPIACEINYQRMKDVQVSPIEQVSRVSFVAGDHEFMSVDKGTVGTLQQLLLRPVRTGTQVLQARILGPFGPIISRQAVDEFTISTTASRAVGLLKVYPDGSHLLSATLWQTPLVRNLEVRLHVFVGGVTFADSSGDMSINTNDFTAIGDQGRYDYALILMPDGAIHACHSLTVYQNNIQVSR